jgi:hypothetical protein
VVFLKTNQETADPFQDRRRSDRHAVVTQVAKIRLSSGREELCLLRDISAGGLKADVYIPLGPGDHLDIELRTAHSVGCRIVWANEGTIGVAFDEPIPAAAILAHCAFNDHGGGNLRPPRLKANMRGLLRIDAASSAVTISNISQAGLQIEAPAPFKSGTACTIVLPGLAARAATICWWRDGCAGLMLDEAIDYADFAKWRSASTQR